MLVVCTSPNFTLGLRANIRDKVMAMAENSLQEIACSACIVEVGNQTISAFGADEKMVKASGVNAYDVPPQND